MMRYTQAIFAFLVILLAASQASAEMLRSFRSSSWSVGSYSDDSSKQFSHCAAYVKYNSGITLFVSIDRTYQWKLAFMSENWNMASGEKIPVTVSFDGRSPYSGVAFASAKNLAVLPVSQDSSSNIWNDFRQSILMSVNSSGRTVQFKLDGTSRLMIALKACVDAELLHESGGPLPQFVSTAIQPPPQKPQIPTVPGTTNTTPLADAERELIATRIATNLLLQTRLPNAQLVGSSDIPDYVRGRGVAWKADGVYGTVAIYSRSAVNDAQQAATQITQSDSGICKGDFASIRAQSLVDGKIITRVSTGCKMSSGGWAGRYFILDGAQSGWIVYSILSQDLAPTQSDNSPLSNDNFQTAAIKASFVK